MNGGHLIREARLSAGLSQDALASRLKTSQATIFRWESGERSPSVKSLVAAVRACGYDVDFRLVPKDDHDFELAAGLSALDPVNRVELMLGAQKAVRELVRDARRS